MRDTYSNVRSLILFAIVGLGIWVYNSHLETEQEEGTAGCPHISQLKVNPKTGDQMRIDLCFTPTHEEFRIFLNGELAEIVTRRPNEPPVSQYKDQSVINKFTQQKMDPT